MKLHSNYNSHFAIHLIANKSYIKVIHYRYIEKYKEILQIGYMHTKIIYIITKHYYKSKKLSTSIFFKILSYII